MKSSIFILSTTLLLCATQTLAVDADQPNSLVSFIKIINTLRIMISKNKE